MAHISYDQLMQMLGGKQHDDWCQQPQDETVWVPSGFLATPDQIKHAFLGLADPKQPIPPATKQESFDLRVIHNMFDNMELDKMKPDERILFCEDSSPHLLLKGTLDASGNFTATERMTYSDQDEGKKFTKLKQPVTLPGGEQKKTLDAVTDLINYLQDEKINYAVNEGKDDGFFEGLGIQKTSLTEEQLKAFNALPHRQVDPPRVDDNPFGAMEPPKRNLVADNPMEKALKQFREGYAPVPQTHEALVPGVPGKTSNAKRG